MVDKISVSKLKIVVNISSMQKCFFYHGKVVQNRWVESNTTFMNNVGSEYWQSSKILLITWELVVTEVNEIFLPKFEKEEERKEHLEGLKYCKQELSEETK